MKRAVEETTAPMYNHRRDIGVKSDSCSLGV